MLKCPEAAGFLAASLLVASSVGAEPLGLGRIATPDEVAAWDIDVRPDGSGLPQGRGDVATGEDLFADQCASCHGDFGEGVDRWPVLAGGFDTLTEERPVKTIGSYWPYLSTVWDYVHRAMPFGAAQSLSDDEVYAITAYLLYANDLVDDEFELSHENFADIRLPNEASFVPDDREQSPVFQAPDTCMSACKTDVQITARARILDVTPEDEREASAEEVAVAAPAYDAELAAAGEKVFKKCKACHQVGEGAKSRVGPALNGIVGAALGAQGGYKYSKALTARAAEGAVWDAAALDAFLEKPKKWLKGTKMAFAGLKKPDDRAALIEFLKSQGQ